MEHEAVDLAQLRQGKKAPKPYVNCGAARGGRGIACTLTLNAEKQDEMIAVEI